MDLDDELEDTNARNISMNDESHSLGNGKCIRETDKAILVKLDDDDSERWIPKSQLHDDSEVFDELGNADGEVIVKLWFAEKEGWV